MATKLYKKCDTCGGDGVVSITYPPGSPTCWCCGGSGKIEVFEIDLTILQDMYARQDDILDKLKDIKEKLDEL